MSTKNLDWREKLKAVDVKWFYSWGPLAPENTPRGVEFVPMVFRSMPADKLAQTANSIRKQKSKYLLGLNEPDVAKQGNMSVEEALELWPKLMELGVPLISPGCVHPDKEWMAAFMKGVDERSLRVDYVSVHSYGGPGAESLMRRLETVQRLYKRPIWITEFAVGDWKAKTREENIHKPERILTFMEQILPLLDACEFVDRYAWFPAKPTSIPLGSSALFDANGALTRLGECYRDA